MATKTLIYLHGFNSSPDSIKAKQCVSFFKMQATFNVYVPALTPEPSAAIASVSAYIERVGVHNIVGIVGSSLGGYYGLFLHAKYGLPVVLINPAFKPYELLADFIGMNTNLYTGEAYEVKAEHMAELEVLQTQLVDMNLCKLFLLTESGDEVLDYRQAAHALLGAKSYIIRGGNHAFERFEEFLPAISDFFLSKAPK